MPTYNQEDLLKTLTDQTPIPTLKGMLPPQAPEVEEVVLGAIMLERTAIHLAIQILSPSDFYVPKHQFVYNAILEIFNERKAVDIITVTNKLRAHGKLDEAGGAYGVSELTNRIGSAASLETHARIVKQKSIARQLIEITHSTIQKAYENPDDIFNLINEVQSEILNINRSNSNSDPRPIGEIAAEVIKDIEKARSSESITLGTPSGLIALDRIIGGFQEGDLIILAARPGMGKSSLARTIAKHVAMKEGKPTAIFSMEERDKKVVLAMFSMQTNIQNTHLKNGNLEEREWHILNHANTALSNSPINIDDTPGLNHMEFRSKALALKAKNPELALIVVDYLQLMSASGKKKGQNREQEISEISRNLKLVAMETGVPILALSQLSRAVEQRGGSKRPMLSDLRESGSIEQDADVVVFVYRPEYYGLHEDNPELTGKAELIVAKNRNGSTDTGIVAFEAQTTLFRDLTYSEATHPY